MYRIDFIRDSYLKAGYSRTMKGHMNLRRQYVQAQIALDAGGRKRPYLWIHHFSQVALTYIIEQSTRKLPADMISHEGLLRLREQDQKNHTFTPIWKIRRRYSIWSCRFGFWRRMRRKTTQGNRDDGSHKKLYIGISMRRN